MSTTTVLPYQALERAQRGAKVLDRAFPGWRDQIDLEILDIADCAVCMLGQVFGNYNYAWSDDVMWEEAERYADGPDAFAVDHGFNRAAREDDDDADTGDPDPEYDALTEAWTFVVAGR